MNNVVIMGSTDFTLDCIKKAMFLDNVNIVAIITPEDTKKDRKGNIILSPPSAFAIEEHIPLFKPENINDEHFQKVLKELNIDFIIVVAYGKILSSKTLAIPKIGALNIHGSILPALRGASPVEHALIYGFNQTGTTLQKMSNKLDEGDIILQKEFKIKNEWSHFELYEEIKISGVEVLEDFFNDTEYYMKNAEVQNAKKATYCKKIKKEEGRINFKNKAKSIHNQVRAFSDWPICYCYYNEILLKVYKTKVLDENRLANKDHGLVVEVTPDSLLVQTASGLISILEVQRPSKKRQNIREFLNGMKIKKDEYLS